MKYPMKFKTENPLFNYFIKNNNNENYYLFADFDKALKKLMELSISSNDIYLMYEIYFNTQSREFYLRNSFWCYNNIMDYTRYSKIDLHVHHYVNVGEWLNPNQEWIDIIDILGKGEY